ncbi:MAG: insulinase family protein [Oscillatoriales cyanobacterium SM2_2_1]|nr:insulinase family protein [Oscillatoriales cyanobacterium SM2_2_1]
MTPKIHVLPCGVTVIAEQVPIEAVNLSVWVNAGSALEADAINGMAHFLEHMIFKGSDRLKLGEFEALIESHGGNANAATSQDYTMFYVNVAPQDYTKLAPLQLDLVLRASLPNAEFQRERHVVLEEIRRSEDSPERRLYRYSSEQAYRQLPYRRPVLGPTDVIASVSVEQMRDFHQQWYIPQNMTVVAVGNLPEAELVGAIADYFAMYSAAPTPSHPQMGAEDPFTTIERQEINDPRIQQARMILSWRVPGFSQFAETYPLSILSSILGSGRTSRLVKDLREERHWVQQVSCSYYPHRWQGTFQITAKVPTEHLASVEQVLREHLHRLQTELIPVDELQKIRNQVASRFIFGSESPRERASIYGYYHRIVGNLDSALTYVEQVHAIEPRALRHAAQTYLNPDAYGLLTVRPAALGVAA